MLFDKVIAKKICVCFILFIENYPESVKETRTKDFDFGRFK